MIKINPSNVKSTSPELSSSDIEWQDFKTYFAVSVDRPHYQHLIHYGQDGPENYYVWLAFGQMTGLHKGFTIAIDSMYEKEQLNVYGCRDFKSALEFVREHSTRASPIETISLFYCVMSVAENDHGGDSIEYAAANLYLANFYSRIGEPSVAYECLQITQTIFNKQLPAGHPLIQQCYEAMEIVKTKMEAPECLK